MFDWVSIIIEGIGSDTKHIQSFWVGACLGVFALLVSALVTSLVQFGSPEKNSRVEKLSAIGATFIFASGLGSAFAFIISAISFLVSAVMPEGGVSAGEVIPIAFLSVVLGGLLVGFAATIADIK